LSLSEKDSGVNEDRGKKVEAYEKR